MKSNFPVALTLATLLGSTAAIAGPDPTPAAVTSAQGDATTAPASSAVSPAAAAAAAKPIGVATVDTDAADQQTRAADLAAFFNARLAALHAGLALAPNQESLWPPLEASIRDIANLRRAEWQAMQADRGMKPADQVSGQGVDGKEAAPAAPTGEVAFARLKQTGAQWERHGKALQALADAAEPMFASLNPEQKHRLPVLLRGLVPTRGPITRMMDALGMKMPEANAGMADREQGGGREMPRAEGRADDRGSEQDGMSEPHVRRPMDGDRKWGRGDEDRGDGDHAERGYGHRWDPGYGRDQDGDQRGFQGDMRWRRQGSMDSTEKDDGNTDRGYRDDWDRGGVPGWHHGEFGGWEHGRDRWDGMAARDRDTNEGHGSDN